jgi:hypothetical protein
MQCVWKTEKHSLSSPLCTCFLRDVYETRWKLIEVEIRVFCPRPGLHTRPNMSNKQTSNGEERMRVRRNFTYFKICVWWYYIIESVWNSLILSIFFTWLSDSSVFIGKVSMRIGLPFFNLAICFLIVEC